MGASPAARPAASCGCRSLDGESEPIGFKSSIRVFSIFPFDYFSLLPFCFHLDFEDVFGYFSLLVLNIIPMFHLLVFLLVFPSDLNLCFFHLLKNTF